MMHECILPYTSKNFSPSLSLFLLSSMRQYSPRNEKRKPIAIASMRCVYYIMCTLSFSFLLEYTRARHSYGQLWSSHLKLSAPFLFPR